MCRIKVCRTYGCVGSRCVGHMVHFEENPVGQYLQCKQKTFLHPNLCCTAPLHMQTFSGRFLNLPFPPNPHTYTHTYTHTQVPQSTYELNFVLNNGEGKFENNSGNDFTYPVEGGITWDEWIDSAGERALAAAKEKEAIDKAAAEEAERQRVAYLLQQEKEKGLKMANDMRTGYENLRKGGVLEMDHWRTVPETATAGSKVQLLYNRMKGPLSGLSIPEDKSLTLRYGTNGWQTPQALDMERMQETGSEEVDGEEWWVGVMDLPSEAAAANFVVNYFEHYDNNNGQDYKLLVALPGGQSLEAWSMTLAETFAKQLTASREATEETERKKAAARLSKRRTAQSLVKEVERRKVRHVLYTEPAVVTAGKEVTVFYNPQNTVLNGRQRVFLQGGWNR
jgi:starch synthase